MYIHTSPVHLCRSCLQRFGDFRNNTPLDLGSMHLVDFVDFCRFVSILGSLKWSRLWEPAHKSGPPSEVHLTTGSPRCPCAVFWGRTWKNRQNPYSRDCLGKICQNPDPKKISYKLFLLDRIWQFAWTYLMHGMCSHRHLKIKQKHV